MARSRRAHTEVHKRPLPRALYALAAERWTGVLRAHGSGQAVSLGWRGGRIARADSSFSADELGQVALAARFASPEAVRAARAAAPGGSSPAELLASLDRVAGLGEEGARALAQRWLAQRAARLFALSGAELAFEGDAECEHPQDELGAAPLDARWLITRGLLGHYTEKALEQELTPVATAQLSLAADAAQNLKALRVPEREAVVVDALRGPPASVADIEHTAMRHGGDRRRVLAVLYALLATDCLDVTFPQREAPSPRADRAGRPGAERAAAPSRGAGPGGRAGAPRGVPARAREAETRAPNSAPAPSAHADGLKELITDKLEAVKAGANAFALLGIDRTASTAQVHSAYFALAKKLHPDKLVAAGVPTTQASQRVFSALNWAFGVLNDPAARAAYERGMGSGGAPPDAADDRAKAIMAAEEHARRGERALRNSNFEAAARELEKALELNPEEGEHHALAAWAEWSLARDKDAAVAGVLRRLTKAAELAPNNPRAHYYRGQIAKRAGDLDTAADCFQTVLRLRPDHREASLELRLLTDGRHRRTSTGGLLGKLKRNS